MRWPFEAVRDRDGRAGDWVVLHGPVVTPAQHAQFAELRRGGARFVGMTSYLEFPRGDPRDRLDYEAVCEGWCHCFREPDRYFAQATAPRALISASDFTDCAWVERAAVSALPLGQHDLVYVGATDTWQQTAKNWSLAARCLPRLCRALGMRALVIGTPDATFPRQPGVAFHGALAWRQVLATLSRARLLFVPNAIDPSPRVVAEALCLGLPVLMHRGILGGWKYINRFTGAFFDDERDVVDAAAGVLRADVAPREWFGGNFGPEAAGRRLTALLRRLDVSVDRDAGWRVSAAGPEGRREG
jgi:glycosyltransferase involved in cell wall biosynthesis